MSKQREAMKQALHALQTKGEHHRFVYDAMKALAEALAKPEQEPVAWMCADEDMTRKGYCRFSRNCEGEWNIPVYTTPPARKPLTDEQISAIVQSMSAYTWDAHMLARAVERAHGIGGE